MYIVACKSRMSGYQSVCRNENRFIKFKDKKEAEEYAKKMRDKMGLSYHYWVEKL